VVDFTSILILGSLVDAFVYSQFAWCVGCFWLVICAISSCSNFCNWLVRCQHCAPQFTRRQGVSGLSQVLLARLRCFRYVMHMQYGSIF